jgi:hypothetical protein
MSIFTQARPRAGNAGPGEILGEQGFFPTAQAPFCGSARPTGGFIMLLLKRFLAVAALMFWQGGFTFYAAVVVPVGQTVLGSHLEQGFITRVVTRYMNMAGAAALGILALELLWASRRRPKSLWAVWLAMALVLGALIVLHPSLDSFIDLEGHVLHQRADFRLRHRIYLWVSTIEWLLSGIYLWLLLRDWERSAGK